MMTRADEPYVGGTAVTEEEVESWVSTLKSDRIPLYCEAADFMQRMWQEIKDLRSLLDKQVY